MSQESSTDEPGGSSTKAARQRPRELASGFRFTADLTRSINEAFSLPTNPVMQAFRDLQRSLVQPLLPKMEAAVRLSPSVIEMAALKPAVPQYNLGKSLIEMASRKPVLPPYVLPGMTNFMADQALLAQRMMTPWLTEIGAALTDHIVPHWRVSLTHALDGLFREWSWLASFGADLARRAAQAGLFAAMRAKAALLVEGRLEAVDDFIMNWLGLRPTERRREAVTLVLLEGQWIPVDLEADAHLVLTQIRTLAAKEARAAKSIAATRLRGSRVTLLATHDEKLADPATVEGLPIRGGFDNPRLDQVLARLEPVEQRVAYAYSEGGAAMTWEDAAILEGLPAALGETVRRKCKRARDEIGRRAAMTPPSQIRQQAGRR